MSGAAGDQFAKHARAVACEIFGEPNKTLSTKDELRFGSHGSVSVDLKSGKFFDHQEGVGGGVLWAIERQTGQSVAGGRAVDWMREHGYDIDDSWTPPPRGAQAPANSGQAPAVRLDALGNWLPQRVPDHGQLTATFDYCNADGSLSYQVCRYDWTVPVEINPKGREKTFVQRRPDVTKKNGWAYKMDGVEWLPYRLPELIEDVRNGDTIFVVEGEKKVDMLRKLGVPATCNHGGAGKFPETLVPWFAGADVVILPDSDPQATKKDGELRVHPDGRPVLPGKDHADLVGRRIEGVARRVRILNIPDLPLKGGVDDWLPAGGTVEKLYDLALTAPLFQAKPFQSHFGAVPWLDFGAPGPAYEHLVKGVLTRGEMSMLLGESQSGKSFIAIDIAMAVARGIDWFGNKVKRGGVIYQAGESATGVRRKRFPAYAKHHNLARDPLPIVLLERPVDFYNSDDQVDQFIDECKHWGRTFAVPLELIIIDTFNKATPGANENDGKDMGMVLARCDRIRRETGAHVMLVHHLNAGGTKARGHTSLFANLENVILVKKVENASDADGRKIREWTIAKQKDGDDGVSKRFVLRLIDIGIDADGDKINSCIIGEPNGEAAEPEHPEGINLAGYNTVVLRGIYNAIAKHGVTAPRELALSGGQMAIDREDLRKALREELDADGGDLSLKDGETEEDARKRREAAYRQNVYRAIDTLYRKSVVGRADGWLWLTGKRVRGFEPAPGMGEQRQERRPSTSSTEPPAYLDLPFDGPDDIGDFK